MLSHEVVDSNVKSLNEEGPTVNSDKSYPEVEGWNEHNDSHPMGHLSVTLCERLREPYEITGRETWVFTIEMNASQPGMIGKQKGVATSSKPPTGRHLIEDEKFVVKFARVDIL
jgi:hypothetical protein